MVTCNNARQVLTNVVQQTRDLKKISALSNPNELNVTSKNLNVHAAGLKFVC